MARRLADDGDTDTPRRSVADLLREAGIEQNAAPRRRRRFIEPDEELERDEEVERDDEVERDEAVEGDGAPERVEETVAAKKPGGDENAPSVEADSAAEPDSSAESASPLETGPAPGEEAKPVDDGETTSPIERINDQAPDTAAAKPAREHSGAVHWTLAIGEVVLAIAIGVGLSFIFRLLWDIAPYAAAVLAPVVICAVVAIVGFSRKKMGLGSIPLSLLLLVLFVTALLVVIPAAWVLTAA